MIFKDNKPIYIQIAEYLADQVLSGELVADGRVPSVRETAASLEVNANTVVRSYDHLQQSGIIYNKRGLGYFVMPDAAEVIVNQRREQLLGEELQHMFERIATIGVTADQLGKLYANYLEKNK